jgi:hypothetical protein
MEPSALPTAEVMPFIAPATLTPIRLFLSCVVLLIFLLVAFFSPRTTKKGPKGARTILLVGPLAAGKTALFSKVSSGQGTKSRLGS